MKFVNFLNNLAPEKIFLFFALTFGMAISFITPPFQVPDEFHHFYRSYQLSEGQIKGVREGNRLGGYIPASMLRSSEAFLPTRHGQKANKTEIANFLHTPFSDSTVFTDFPNTAIYSPASYIPQVTSIYILKKFHLSVGAVFYGSRLFNFLLWITVIFYCIRIVPVYKMLFCFLSLLPMSLYVNSSLSADVVTNIGAFVLIAYILKCAFTDEKFTAGNFIIIALLLILLSFTKIVYAPLILLFLIIPQNKFSSKRAFYLQFVSLLLLSFLTILYLSGTMNSLYMPYSAYDANYRDNFVDVYKGSDIHLQAQFIKEHPLYFLKAVFNSVYVAFPRYIRGYIGTFGWLDAELPDKLIFLAYLLLFFIGVIEKDKPDFNLTRKHRIIFLSAFIIMFVLVFTAQYISYAAVGKGVVIVQGRYFIPVFPLMFMFFNRKQTKWQNIIKPVITLFLLLLLSTSLLVLYHRYY